MPSTLVSLSSRLPSLPHPPMAASGATLRAQCRCWAALVAGSRPSLRACLAKSVIHAISVDQREGGRSAAGVVQLGPGAQEVASGLNAGGIEDLLRQRLKVAEQVLSLLPLVAIAFGDQPTQIAAMRCWR